MMDYEHMAALRAAQADVIDLRKRIRKLHWIAGGRGYDNMARRELEHARDKLDELDHWLAGAARALHAGGQRARTPGKEQP